MSRGAKCDELPDGTSTMEVFAKSFSGDHCGGRQLGDTLTFIMILAEAPPPENPLTSTLTIVDASSNTDVLDVGTSEQATLLASWPEKANIRLSLKHEDVQPASVCWTATFKDDDGDAIQEPLTSKDHEPPYFACGKTHQS